jgi:two-component system response regulator RstA
VARILLVEDDLELAELVQARLEREGFDVDHEADGAKAAEQIRRDPPDLVILDVMIPSLDGFGVCREVRPEYGGPILMMTALDDDIDQVLGLELGADDYVIKPVRPRVLIARVKALLRRPMPLPNDADRRVTSGTVSIDRGRREVLRDGSPVILTTTEFDLLWLLASRAGEVVGREEIYRVVYGSEYDGMDRSADVYVSKLRAKLGDDPRRPALLKTVRGTGYLFVPESR